MRIPAGVLFLFALPVPAWSEEAPGAPVGLLCELLREPAATVISDADPEFSWIVNDPRRGAVQSAWRIEVSTDGETIWDSGKTDGAGSVDVRYAGPALEPESIYQWRVQTWDAEGKASPWSDAQSFRTAARLVPGHPLASPDRRNADFTNRPPLVLTEEAPVTVERLRDGHWFIDFGRAAFGNLVLKCEDPTVESVEVALGEKLAADGRIDRRPPGTVRFQSHKLDLEAGAAEHSPQLDWAPPGWMKVGFLGLPDEFGQVMPFRYAEISGAPANFDPASWVVRRSLAQPFEASAADFSSSSPDLDAIWELCKYSIKATTFMGIYVDGDRERKPYEADAYINQLAHYGVDREYITARHSHEFLLQRPTWPLEWQHHSVLMAWEDYLHTGNADSLEANYELLAAKTLQALAREDGLIVDREEFQTPEFLRSLNMDEKLKTIVDWPAGERDGHQITPVDAVANAFHFQTLVLMEKIAAALDRDPAEWRAKREKVRESYQRVFFDEKAGRYRDGEGVSHSSLHSNLFPLVFGLVPDERREAVLEFVKSRGMACSVYGSQYLLDALFQNREAAAAFGLLTSKGLRSWHNMMEKGSTITMEAWDQSLKPNQDWNHAWGAAPANIIPRRIAGVRPVEPGFRRILIEPQPGPLERFDAKVPTIRGTVNVNYRRAGATNGWRIEVPANTTAELRLPTSRPAELREADTPVKDAEGVKTLGYEDGVAILEVGGGSYEFRAPR